MTIDHWLMIAAIISSLIGQVAAVVVGYRIASRMSQPTATPADSQPTNRIQRIGGWVNRLLTVPRLLLFSTLMYLYLLVSALRSPAPVGRATVFAIAAPIAGIALNVGFLALIDLVGIIRQIVDLQRTQFDGLLKIDERTFDAAMESDRRLVGLIRKAAGPPDEDPPVKPPKAKRKRRHG